MSSIPFKNIYLLFLSALLLVFKKLSAPYFHYPSDYNQIVKGINYFIRDTYTSVSLHSCTETHLATPTNIFHRSSCCGHWATASTRGSVKSSYSGEVCCHPESRWDKGEMMLIKLFFWIVHIIFSSILSETGSNFSPYLKVQWLKKTWIIFKLALLYAFKKTYKFPSCLSQPHFFQ